MAWGILIFAGVLEVVWLIALKLSGNFTSRPGYGAVSVVVVWMSFFLLSFALRTIPTGTAYAVWTGLGAAGGAVAGMLLFGESREVSRLLCIGLIVMGIVGIKVTE